MKPAKKLLLVLLLLFSAKLQAQFVFVPDSNFRDYIKQYIDSNAIVGNNLDTSNTRIISIKNLNIDNNIHDLNGIQYFDSLNTLFLFENNIDSLVYFPLQLKSLRTYDNHIQYINNLPNSLEKLDLTQEELSSLNVLPNFLKELYINDCGIVSVPNFPTSLRVLDLQNNHLTSLPILPDSLIVLYCDNNPLLSLPILNSTLKSLSCNYSVHCLPLLPNSLEYLSYNGPCIPNVPPLLYLYYPVCNANLHYVDVPDSIISICNDSLYISDNFYSLLWNTGDTAGILNNVCRDTFQYTLINSLGCYISNTINLIDTTLVSDIYTNALHTCSEYDVCDFVCSINVSGGTPPYHYQWINDPFHPFNNFTEKDTLANLVHICNDNMNSCFTIKCRVYDAIGREDTAIVSFCFPLKPHDTYLALIDPVCPGINDGVIYAESSTNSNQQPSWPMHILATDLTPGTYNYTVSYVNGCIDTFTYTLNSYQFQDCNEIYEKLITPPHQCSCDGRFEITDIYDHGGFSFNIYSFVGFDEIKDIYGKPVPFDSLCPNKWYFFRPYYDNGYPEYLDIDSVFISGQIGCPPVYPGDANYDGIANNLDLLSIGIAYGDTGNVRTDTSIAWSAKYVQDWVNVFADSTNHKHADCNGNGIINNDDTIAIIQNYGLTHQRPILSSMNIAGAPSLYIDLPDTLSPFTNYVIPVYLGDSLSNADSIYGIAFSIIYDPSLLVSSSLQWHTDSGWLGNYSIDLLDLQYKPAPGRIDVGVSRIDQVNKNGFGKIGILQFTTRTLSIDQAFSMNTENITAISNDEKHHTINSTTDSTWLIHGNCAMNLMSNSTIGCNSWCAGSASVFAFNSNGSVNYDWSSSQFNSSHCFPALINSNTLNYLPTGTYVCTVTDSITCAESISISVVSVISTINPSESSKRESCLACDGFVHLTVTGGYPPYTFSWDTSITNIGNNSITSKDLDSICINNKTFMCNVTDSIGCSRYYYQSFPLNVCLPEIWNSNTIAACTNQNNGSISLQPDPGSYLSCHPYTGSFTPLPNGAVFNNNSFPHVFLNNIPPGNYEYIITTTSLCDTISVNVPEITIQVITTNPSCGNCNGTAIALINGDTVNNGNNGWVFWSNDTNALQPKIDSIICQLQLVQYNIYYPLCPVINGTIILDSCDFVSSVPTNQNYKFPHFMIFPNPNNGSFTIQLPQALNSKAKIEITNVLGELVYVGGMPSGENKKEISLPKLQPGLFNCRIITDEKVLMHSFIIR